MEKVFLNNQFVAPGDAKISVFDRGFLFSDGVYEVVPIFNRKPFLMSAHLERLNRSLSELGINSPNLDFSKILIELMSFEKGEHFIYYIQVTRGQEAIRNHLYSESIEPNVVCFLQSFEKVRPEKGYHAITALEPRWNRCDIKSISLLPNILYKKKADMNGAIECIFYDSSHCLTEATASNVFVVKQGTVYTPMKEGNILKGITREFMLKTLKNKGVSVKETLVSLNDLFSADEVWVSSSTKNAIPIVNIDNRTISKGLPGPLWKQVYDWIEESQK